MQYIEGAVNINVENNTFDSNGLGFFCLTNDSNQEVCQTLLIQGNTFTNNGVPGSYSEHNSYVEANGVTYQYNNYEPLISGSAGAQLKDRSAGAVIRYNNFAPAATILDLVDAEDSGMLAALPSYANTYVYGNILNDTGPNYTSVLVEFGNDSGLNECRTNLYFYDNTVVTVANRSASWRTEMFLPQCGNANYFYVANNIFYNAPATSGAAPSIFEFIAGYASAGNPAQGNITFSPTNWVSPGWLPSEAYELWQDYGGALSSYYIGTITGTNTFFVDPNNNPGFVSLAGGNYQLATGSNAIGIAGALGSGWPAVTQQYVAPTSGTARSDTNIGAY